MTWGPEIPHDGGAKPVWLADGEIVGPRRWSTDESTSRPGEAQYILWDELASFRLPADHWAYPVITKGFTPHAGSDAAPGDWDGGPVLRRNGHVIISPGARWVWIGVVGYCRTPTPAEAPVSDTVPVKRMTEGEARALFHRSHVSNGLNSDPAVAMMRALNIIREPEPEPEPIPTAADLIRQCVAFAEAGQVIPPGGLAPMRAWLDRETGK